MARRKYVIDEAKIQRFLAEGRGTGEGMNYQPWLTIQDVPSSGLSTRILGGTTGRLHQLLSENETRLFLILDFSSLVVDIREQFPLDRADTQRIAEAMGVTHPREPREGNDIVMTTDFLITMQRNGERWHVARSVKPWKELDRLRVLEKQEIERRYWDERGVTLKLVTEEQLPKTLTLNLMWLSEMRSLEKLCVPYEGYWEDRMNVLLSNLATAKNSSIKKFIALLESHYGFQTGEAITAIRHLAANKIIKFDMHKEWDINRSLDTLSITDRLCVAEEFKNVIG